jgi:hypothetical protein
LEVTIGAAIKFRHPAAIINPPTAALHEMIPLMLKQPMISKARPVITSRAHATLVVTSTAILRLQREAQHNVPRMEIALNINYQRKTVSSLNF